MSTERSLRRWRIACALLAAFVLYGWVRDGSVASPGAASVHARGDRLPPLKVRASALGVSTDELVQRLLAAHDAVEMRPIAERLALVAGDEIVEPLRPLVDDAREGVPALVLGLYGRAGGDRAVDALLEIARARKPALVDAVIDALGATRSPRAETFLIGELDRGTLAAIDALATIGSDGAIAAVANVAETGTDTMQAEAFAALARLQTPASNAALVALIDAPSVLTATRAIDALTDIDDDTFDKLASIASAGDLELGPSAVSALGRAGDRAAPVLADIARDGSGTLRTTAVRALGAMRTSSAIDALRSVIDGDDSDLAMAALEALAAIDLPDARDVLVEVAMSDGPYAGTAVDELATLTGPEIEAALVTLAKSDSDVAANALGHLLERESDEALAIVAARAMTGDDEARFEAFALLAGAGTQAALDKLVEIVRTTHGTLKARAIELLATQKPGDAGVGELLRDTLRAGDPTEALAAAYALANVGTPEARDALVAALSSASSDLVYAVVRALEKYRLDDAGAAALARAADANPDIRGIVIAKLVAAGAPSGLDLARRAIASGDPQAAYAAIDSLRGTGSKLAFDLLADAARVTSGDVRSLAIRALGETRDPRAVDVVVAALDDESARYNAAAALRSIGGERATQALLGLTRSADPEARITALSNLPSLEDPTMIRRVGELVRSDPNARVRDYAIYALVQQGAGAAALRPLVGDSSVAYDTRYAIASTLTQVGLADDRVSRWFESATAPE